MRQDGLPIELRQIEDFKEAWANQWFIGYIAAGKDQKFGYLLPGGSSWEGKFDTEMEAFIALVETHAEEIECLAPFFGFTKQPEVTVTPIEGSEK